MSKSASERVFGIADLVDCICGNAAIRNDDGTLTNWYFFFTFARINKIAATPALREIWRHLDVHSARKILKLLPENPASQLTVIRGGDKPKTQQQIVQLELGRIFFYCEMVEFFHALGWTSIEATRLNDFLNLVQLHMPSKIVFPRLKSLLFPLTHGHCNLNLSGLGLTQIEHISVLSHPTFCSQLIDITPLFPVIRTLELKDDIVALSPWKETIKRAVGTMSSLRNLIITTSRSIAPYILADIATIPTIKMIKFNIRTSNHPEPPNINSFSSSRQSSRDLILKMTRGDFDIISTLLRQSQSVSISHSVLIFDGIDKDSIEQPSVDRAITAIVDTCPSLKMLTIIATRSSGSSFYRPISTEDDILVISSQTLEPLTRLSHITTLDLHLETALIITPTFLNHIAEFWSSLQYCYLSPFKRFELEKNEEPLLRLPDIIHFASRCPSLHTLGVVFDLELDIIEREGWFEQSPCLPVARAMKKLDVGSSGIWDHRRTASIISTAFPFLDNFAWTGPSFKSTMCMSARESEEWFKTQNLVFGLCS
ncbi:hypothetical protein FRB91_010903 [Serendipita sp. 411]|nr:hypothetical protein FRB91_010903 [Serendipita sp. 411]KAG8867150.1 hypothetical protein FRC20_006585 [Serendipita sp. 405]